MINRVKSIDGIFNDYVNIKEFNNINQKLTKYNVILGKGNSISSIPYIKNGLVIKPTFENKFIIDNKKNTLTTNGNATILDIHNYLIKKKYYCHYFPSYPFVTVGACIANGTHGIMPKKGIFTDFVKEIKIFNPNFGVKTLSRLKNKDLFELTKCGLGLTGLILEAKIKIFKLRSTLISINNYDFNNLFDCYKFMKKSKKIYNQNSFTINYSKKNIFSGRLIVGSFKSKNFKQKNIKVKKITKKRLGIFKISFLKNLLFEIIFYLENIKIFFNKKQHINDIIFTSNKRTSYFLFMPKKFIEYQNIIPKNKIEVYLKNFEDLVVKYKPDITLLHLKIFDQNGKNFEFKMKGLAIAIHIIKNKNFSLFYNKLIKLDQKFNCKINLYKNSLVDTNLVKVFYPNYYKKFSNKIKKMNKKFKFTNNIFGRFIYANNKFS